MEKVDKLGYDLALIIETFNINVPDESTLLNEWLAADYTLNENEQWLFDRVYARTRIDGGYWNEEELKIKFVGSVFDLADVDTKDKIKVFYVNNLDIIDANEGSEISASHIFNQPNLVIRKWELP